MNHYPRHIGDYLKETSHLSLLEHGVYTRLLDVYYMDEKPLPNSVSAVCRLIRAKKKTEKDAVRSVLAEFFTWDEFGFHQKRCDEELTKYREKKQQVSDFWNGIPRSQRTAMEAARRAAKLNATPRWLSGDDIKAIDQMYEKASAMTAATGIPHEVDHVVPLMGRDVRGLHVPWNLQVIPAYQNRAKGRAH